MQQQIVQNVGIYCRLSKEDSSDTTSVSIENQQAALVEFAIKNKLNIFDIYVDDGYSGTNFDRPSFKRLINDIEDKKINMVITKDLSRLGRSISKSIYYTEEYFPSKNVRFIAVNDDVDSEKENEIAPVKHMLNEWYARDISKKIRYSFKQKFNLPKVLGSGVPHYGYEFTKDKQRVPNLEVAHVVKQIFIDYTNGKSTLQITNELTSRKIFTPAYYAYIKFNHNVKKYENIEEVKKYQWNNDMVTRMIRSREYTGDLVNHKTEKKSYKIKKKVKVSEENQQIFENLFEPIISRELYNKANQIMDKQVNASIPLELKVFMGLCECDNCKKDLKYSNNSSKYSKIIYYTCKNKNCNNKSRIRTELLENVLVKELIELKNIINNNISELKVYAKTFFKPTKDNDNERTLKLINSLKIDNNKVDLKINKLLDSHMDNLITTSTFNDLMLKTKNEKLDIEKRIIDLQKQIVAIEEPTDYLELLNYFIKNINRIDFTTKLTREEISKFIEKINVNKIDDKYELTITYKGKIEVLLKEFNNDK